MMQVLELKGELHNSGADQLKAQIAQLQAQIQSQGGSQGAPG